MTQRIFRWWLRLTIPTSPILREPFRRQPRYWGFIPRQNVIGRPMFVYWSFEASEDEYTRDSAAARTGSKVHVMLHFFDETRWQ